MKILQINKYIYQRRGAETYLFNLSDLLQQHGHEIAYFGMEYSENIETPWNKFFVSEVDYSTKNLKAAKRMFWSTEAQRKLNALLDEFKPDVAHLHNIYHQLSPSILTTLKKRGIPIVLTLHDYKLICPNYELYTENDTCNRCKGGKYYNAVLHRCLKGSTALSTLAMLEMYAHKAMQVYEKNVDCFIAPSQYLRNTVLDWGERLKRIEVLPNFVPNTQVPPPVTTKDFLYAGSLSEIKGVKLLLDNFNENRYPARLLLAGSGPLQAQVIAAAQSNPNIVFLGKLGKKELQAALAKAYAVIAPSRHPENFPFSVLEAFAAGKAVIGSQRGGIPELVQEHKTGWLFEPNKPATFTAAITHALQNPNLVTQYGQQAYQLATTVYSPATHYEQLMHIYESLLG